MIEKINQIIENYKNQKSGPNEIKSRLYELLPYSETKVYAEALLAFFFGEVVENKEFVQNNSLKVIINGEIYDEFGEFITENIILYKDKVIATISDIPDNLPENIEAVNVYDAKDCLITPGLVDQHIHGGYDCDFNTADEEDMIKLAQELPKHGITSILPTVMTAPPEQIKQQIEKIKNTKEIKPLNSTKYIGIHLEGPYLCQKYKGIQPEDLIVNPDIKAFQEVESSEIKMVSYSPELDKDYEFTKYLKSKNIIPSAGHTSATANEINEAVKYGLKQVTHLFNAMPPLHHRNPGVIGEALINDNIYSEVIADGLHIDYKIIELVLRAKTHDKIIFISDSLPLNNSRNDFIIFGGQKIYKNEGKAVNSDGTMAGSLMFLDSILRNTVGRLMSFSDFIKFASVNPLRNIGINTPLFITKGALADIVIWKSVDNYKVKATFINGELAFKE